LSKISLGGGFHRHEFFEEIISLDNLFSAWREFKKGKLKKQDIARFALDIEEEIFLLHKELKSLTYRHKGYTHFVICDPKRRDVHKARARDRLLHHAIFRILEPVFDRGFIYDSFSSRKDKGIHKAHNRFQKFAWKLSRNNTKTVWTLKCDIRKFFDSVDHKILLEILSKKLGPKTIGLLREIIDSFETCAGKGIPIGNLTSQLFSNIYLNELDQFVKRKFCIKYYIRYADDFVILSSDKDYLNRLIPILAEFLDAKLKLAMHADKIIIRKWNQGIDFLGYNMFPHYKILRTRTKQRILRKVSKSSSFQSLQSYLGILKHCRGHNIERKIRQLYYGNS